MIEQEILASSSSTPPGLDFVRMVQATVANLEHCHLLVLTSISSHNPRLESTVNKDVLNTATVQKFLNISSPVVSLRGASIAAFLNGIPSMATEHAGDTAQCF